MKQEHAPQDKKFYTKGIDQQTNEEIVGLSQDGTYLDAHNMRATSTEGNQSSLEKIKGETNVYSDNFTGTYKCIATANSNGRIVEVWAGANQITEPAYIRVDGDVVCQSSNLPFVNSQPLQVDVDNTYEAGLIILTNETTPPIIFDITDMVDNFNLSTQKYFTAFDLKLYEVNLSSPLDIPVFKELVNVGGGGGLPVGSYSYSMRYVAKSGDRTNWSLATPPIPVVARIAPGGKIHPNCKTYGREPSPTLPTPYAIKLQFRVTNIYNYDFIEIKRSPVNSGAGKDFDPQDLIVARIEIADQEISVRTYLDPVNATDSIPTSEKDDLSEMNYIESAKTVRFADRRAVLMNVKVAEKTSNLTILEMSGQKMWPVIESIGKDGHADPYNHTYKKNYTGGEKFGFGIQLFDGLFSRGFVQKIDGFTNWQYPNRRNRASALTKTYSQGIVKAATSELLSPQPIDSTHEVFDILQAEQKTDACSFKNIYKSDRVGATGFKTVERLKSLWTLGDNANTYCDIQYATNGEASKIENQGSNVDASLSGVVLPASTVYPYYHPFTPVSGNDIDTNGHDYRINLEVDTGSVEKPYNPKGFAPDYYTHGMALGGVTNFPKWAKSFSVVRTAPAGRVVCQGLGMYRLNPAEYDFAGNTALATKDTDRLWFFSPDLENGLVASEIFDDIVNNPNNYELQMVSPLGFFTEIYNFENNTIQTERDRLIDLISYARVIKDIISPENAINPGDATMGVPDITAPLDPFHYVTHTKWRNDILTPPPNFGSDGDTLYAIDSVIRKVDGRGAYLDFQLNLQLYGTSGTGGSGNNNFEDTNMKNFHEPLYIVNIVRKGAVVPDKNINSYVSTGHYQKLESIIGESNGQPGQIFPLIDERPEDCIPPFYNTTKDMFVYIRDLDGNEKAYVNVVNKTVGQIAAINADIATNGFWEPTPGFKVYGLYTSSFTNEYDRSHIIIFNQGYTPPVKSRIIVKYVPENPIRFFGGDSIIGESLFAPIDREASGDASLDLSMPFSGTGKDVDNQFALGIGWPYRKFALNPRNYIITRTTGANRIQDQTACSLGYIRQMVMMFTVESRLSLPYAYSARYPLQAFPNINYIKRPNRWDPAKSIEENNIYPQYVEDYGEDEISNWRYGGFRFTQNINPDYSAQNRYEFINKPEFGFEEQTHYPNRVIWSLPRPAIKKSQPGNRTFPPSNAFDTDTRTGQITKAWSDRTTDKGENLYAFTEKGVCLLLTKKSVLSNLTGADIEITGNTIFVAGEYWLSNQIGMPDELWRASAEGLIKTLTDQGVVVRDAIFFIDNTTAYKLMDNVIVDIGRTGYYPTLSQAISQIQKGYATKVTAVVDEEHNEYWLDLNNVSQSTGGGDTRPLVASPIVPSPAEPEDFTGRPPLTTQQRKLQEPRKLYVFDNYTNKWRGTFAYGYEQYLSLDKNVYGMRGQLTNKLNSGSQINGEDILGFVTNVSTLVDSFEKEFIRIKIHTTGTKPTEIAFYDELNGTKLCSLSLPQQGPLYLKDYDGWEQFIPRKDAAVSASRDRVQSRKSVYEIIHVGNQEFILINTNMQAKILK